MGTSVHLHEEVMMSDEPIVKEKPGEVLYLHLESNYPPAGATLRDLGELVSNASRVGLSPDTVVKVRAGWRQQIRQLVVEKQKSK